MDVDKHNYMKKLKERFPKIYPQIKAHPGLYIMDINHDNWCKFLTAEGEYCNCDPDMSIKRYGEG